MRILIPIFLVLVSLFFLVPYDSESALENDDYTLKAEGFAISGEKVDDSTFSIYFKIKDSGLNKILDFDTGTIMVSGIESRILDNLNARLIRDGDLFRLSGETETGDRFTVLGKIIGEGKDGAIYSMRGVLTSETGDRKQLAYSVMVTNIFLSEETMAQKEEQIKQEELTEQQEITMISSYTKFRELKQNFHFQVRVYDASVNPPPDFTLNQGIIEGAKITVKILNSEGVLIKKFEGISDERGYYSDEYRIESYLRTGKYLVDIKSQFGDSTIDKQFDLFLTEREESD